MTSDSLWVAGIFFLPTWATDQELQFLVSIPDPTTCVLDNLTVLLTTLVEETSN